MKRRIQLLVICLVLFLFSSITLASEIEEITILGEDRTEEWVILMALPFSEGEVWQDEYVDWTTTRLMELNIFQEVSVDAQSLASGGVRVVVEVEEGGILANNLTLFVLQKMAQYMATDYRQTIHNPEGYGINYFGHGNWHGMGIGLTGPLPQRWSYKFAYHNLDENPTFANYDTGYQDVHQEVEVKLTHYRSPSWKQVYAINYYTGNGVTYSGASLEANFNTFAQIDLKGSYLVGWRDQSPAIWKLGAGFSKEFQLTRGLSFLTATKMGTLSSKTPLQLQYQGGGFTGDLALRGSSRWIASHYTITQFELEQNLRHGWSLVGFMDLGKFDLDEFNLYSDWQFNPGLGIHYQSPLDMNLAVDVFYKSQHYELGWNAGIEFTY